jgi:hypothetical protein
MKNGWLILLAILGVGFFTLFTDNTSAQAQTYCYQATRLSENTNGRVIAYPALPNRLRSSAGFSGRVTGYIPAGHTFYIVDGPSCIDGVYWWYVNYNNAYGWTAEGDGGRQYWLEPATTTQTCTLIPRLIVGQAGRVLPGLPNVLRSAAGTGGNSRIIGEIPGGAVFTTVEGPACASDGRLWWRVNYNGLVGWTGEGEGTTYWVEPYQITTPQCPSTLPSRLTVGRNGAVTTYPNLPNIVRQNPGTNNARVGAIPAGGTFIVLSGPTCVQNMAWWQVQYGNLIGWTPEGAGYQYWLEPR